MKFIISDSLSLLPIVFAVHFAIYFIAKKNKKSIGEFHSYCHFQNQTNLNDKRLIYQHRRTKYRKIYAILIMK